MTTHPIQPTELTRPTRPNHPPAPIRAKTAFLAVVLAATTVLAGPVLAADLSVTVNVRGKTDGSVLLGLYDSAANFRVKMLQGLKQPAADTPVVFKITGLPAGDYAIAVYQDLNDNGKLDSNLLGMPTEPYTFSREPKGLMAPPGWDQVKFSLPEGGTAMALELGK